MPRKDPEAYRAYMREYMKKLAADRRASLEAVGMIQARAGEGRSRVERKQEERDERDEPDGREYALLLPGPSRYWG